MIIDQSEIDALLNEAQSVEDELAVAPPPPPAAFPPKAAVCVETASPQIRRLLRLRVPVIAVLAQRPMHVSQVRKLSLGTILEFEKNVDDPLELMINNKPIATGEAVKVGEQFGLRVREVRDAATRIRSMG